jgi:hypothetical protein
MKIKKFLPMALLVAGALFISSSVAIADTTTLTRDERAAQIHAQYDGTFADLASRLAILAPKLKLDINLARQYSAVILDFNTMRATINDGLASATQDVEAMGQLAEEETGEFTSTVYNLETAAGKIKTIMCVKAKVTKKVSGLTPVCPKGYTKKK